MNYADMILGTWYPRGGIHTVVDGLVSLATSLGVEFEYNSLFGRRSYAHNDFIADYNAFKGNAYGLANTLSQTANLKPSIVSRKLNNLFYTGQLTVPGPGVPLR